MILSVICFCFGIFVLHFFMTKTDSEFLIFITHLIVYAVAFIPAYIYSYFAPKGNWFMMICTLMENILMIVLVNEFISDRLVEFYGNGKRISDLIILIIVTLIMSIPAIAVGAFTFYEYYDNKM